MALYHLKRHPTDIECEALFGVSPKWGREKCWFIVEKIRALKEQKLFGLTLEKMCGL